MKILLIDDNVDTVTMLQKFLKLSGHECHTSSDGRNGLVMINSKNFDVLLLDLAMPNFSGYDVIDQLCQSGKIKQIKTIIFTASTLKKEDVDSLMEKGVSSILRKPIELHLLTEAFEN